MKYSLWVGCKVCNVIPLEPLDGETSEPIHYRFTASLHHLTSLKSQHERSPVQVFFI